MDCASNEFRDLFRTILPNETGDGSQPEREPADIRLMRAHIDTTDHLIVWDLDDSFIEGTEIFLCESLWEANFIVLVIKD